MSLLRTLPLPLLLALTAPAAQAQARLFCCSDANGRHVCGDTLPQICYDRAYREMSSGGRVLREVEAPLTPEQRARKDAELRVQREKAAKEAEARRRDQVLLESYATVGELDRRRDRDLGNLEGEIRSAQSREAALVGEIAKLMKQKPEKPPVPRQLAENLAVNNSELEALRTVIQVKRKEGELLRDKFDLDRKRYLELTQPASAVLTNGQSGK